jgi:hypothetical protein
MSLRVAQNEQKPKTGKSKKNRKHRYLAAGKGDLV